MRPGHRQQQTKLLLDVNPLQLCCLPCWGSEKSTTLLLPLMGGLSTHLLPPAQGQRKDSGSEAASTSASSCWVSLRASFGFQSSFASNPKSSVCLCPCLPNSSSPSYYSPNQLYGSEFAQFSIWFSESQSPYRSPDTANRKAQHIKVNLKIYTIECYFIDCIFWGTKGHNG